MLWTMWDRIQGTAYCMGKRVSDSSLWARLAVAPLSQSMVILVQVTYLLSMSCELVPNFRHLPS